MFFWNSLAFSMIQQMLAIVLWFLCLFWNSLAFSTIHQMLANWSLVPPPFLKPSLSIWKFTVHVLLKPGLENFEHYFTSVSSTLVAQRLKSLPPMRETRVRSLGREDPLEKEIAIHSSILAWRIPWMEKPSRLQSTGSQRVWHDWATSPHLTSY